LTQVGPTTWHIVTGEYPPTPGGVSDYSRLVATGLAAAKDEVHVWAPAAAGGLVEDPAVQVHPLPLGYGPRGLLALSQSLPRGRGPQRILVQYVPQAFGMMGVNLPFCAWLASVRGAEIFVMFHEVAMNWASPRRWKQNAAAAAMRAMAVLLLARADRVFVSTLAWEPTLRSLSIRPRAATWLPVPSNVPVHASQGARSTTRARLGIAEGAQVVGHFGTYGSLNAPLLARALSTVLGANQQRVALLVGRDGEAFVRGLDGALQGRVLATGAVDAPRIADYLLACDVLMQPYADGVSTRRTSAMAGLALGLPIATNETRFTEPIWRDSGAVEMALGGEDVGAAAERLLGDPHHAAAVGLRGRRLYEQRFSLERVVALLRE
jgi:glycosyltransferase involved in cell wall biosynthesis